MVAHADGTDSIFDEDGVLDDLTEWLFGARTFRDAISDKNWELQMPGGWKLSSSVPQSYYTTPTQSVEDKYGNVTNYYRGGDTTTTSIIDSYNKTFNTIHNTTNNTNNYQANVKLSDFLNSYTTNNNNYTYSADFKSWYYDNTQNTLNYSNNYTYYNTDNSKYYISIDNSKDEYYLVDVQYSPTFVTVNYTYNTTNNIDNSTTINNTVGDVTNVYYFELKDGRNSSELTASEVAGLDLGYDVVNYDLIPDDPNTLSLQHFDGDYNDSSTYNREFYSVNRSTTYGDAGDFGGAVQLVSGAAAGVKIPDLSSYDGLQFDFRIRYDAVASLGIYIGDTCIFEKIPSYRIWTGKDLFSDNGNYFRCKTKAGWFWEGETYTLDRVNSNLIDESLKYVPVSTISSSMVIPTSFISPNFSDGSVLGYGFLDASVIPSLFSSKTVFGFRCYSRIGGTNSDSCSFIVDHYIDKEYRCSSKYILADFSYDNYKDKWLPMRITFKDGTLYYFVNGDLVGSGPFTMPENADKFYIKSSGTLWLDELRISTGDLVSTTAYTPSSSPYDTNMVLALPDELKANTIYVQHATPISAHRIGGVRPSAPTTGFFYIPLHSDYTGGQPQLYDGANWVNVTAMVYDGKALHDALGYKFSPVGTAPDVVEDLKPGGSTSQDPETCTHEWVELERKAPTCTLSGSVTSGCRRCKKEKTETLPKLGHTWEVKQSEQTTYDEVGNVLTEGFTIYRCTACGEEYKDTDGKGPPSGSSSGGDSSGDGILGHLKKIFTSILDGLSSAAGMLGEIGGSIGTIWSWMPPEISALFVAGVSILLFFVLIKLFLH